LKIEILRQDDVSLRLLVEESDAAFMNALRRTIISEVPVMAVDDVVIVENSSPLQDEFLAHRIGLIPLRTDLDTYNLPEECKCESEFGCNLCRVSLILEMETDDQTQVVYSGNFKSENPAVVPTSEKIPIVKLAPGQKIRLEAYAKLGRGKTHARWQPVSVAAYKHMPNIAVKEELCDVCGECIKVCPKRIFVKSEGKVQIRMVNECTLCQDCVVACQKTPKAIEVTGDESSFIFEIESTGALQPARILREALSILDSKLEEFSKQITGDKDEKSKN
jgi:DNA-directed RNA polymerase subunit D